MSRCAHLFVGIVLPDTANPKHQASPTHRYDPANNPFSYYERTQMVRGCLIGAGYQENDFTVHPFPIDRPELISNYLPAQAEISLYVTVYSDWSRHKAQLLAQLGYRVELFDKNPGARRATGTELRNCLRTGADFSKIGLTGGCNRYQTAGAGSEAGQPDWVRLRFDWLGGSGLLAQLAIELAGFGASLQGNLVEALQIEPVEIAQP